MNRGSFLSTRCMGWNSNFEKPRRRDEIMMNLMRSVEWVSEESDLKVESDVTLRFAGWFGAVLGGLPKVDWVSRGSSC